MWQIPRAIAIRSVTMSGNHGGLSSAFGLVTEEEAYDRETLGDHQNARPQEMVEFLKRTLDFPRIQDRGIH